MEDKLYGVRVHVGTGNSLSLDLRGAGSVYLEPGREYYFENTPINFINRLVELKKIGITYKIDENRRGCYKTVNMINYDVVAARSLLSKIKGLYDVPAPKVEEPKVEEPKVEEPKVEEHVVDVTEPVEEVTEEIVEDVADVVDDEVIETKESVEIVDDSIDSVEVPSGKEIEAMSKPKLLELASSLGIDSVSDLNTKKEIKAAIYEKIGA